MKQQTFQYISGMVMYTIQNDKLRDYIREGIINVWGDHQLDQSTYVIHCAGISKGEVMKKLKKICEEAESKSNMSFDKEDYVVFYRATNSDDNPNRDRIERIPIIGTQN